MSADKPLFDRLAAAHQREAAKKQSQGAKAVANGLVVEEAIRSTLRLQCFTPVRAATLAELRSKGNGLFPESGCFATHCDVPLKAPYHAGKNRTARVDFAIITLHGDEVLLSIKSQQTSGTTDEKLEFETQQLIATELPSILLVHGNGFRLHLLEEIWERTKWFGEKRVYLFRDIDRLTRWIRDGLPVAGRGRTFSDIFAEYCDREP